ncbi:MAG: hypothetical protein IJ716_14270 [Lachnospiraceae bacterium]|nr:hypothetical protein [Lachnospiraceae bacterium]
MSDFDRTPPSRFEEILRAIIDGTEYTNEPRSVMEALLIELKETIEAGGGGGGGTSTIAWKPTVSEEGVISWRRTASETAPAEQNIKGVGIKNVEYREVSGKTHLFVIYTDDEEEDVGEITTADTEPLTQEQMTALLALIS